jgi:hypothetical protein
LLETAPSKELPVLLYEVVRDRGHWRVLHIGKHSPPHPDQATAIAAAVDSAKQARASGREVVVRLFRTDGKVIALDPNSGLEI